MVWRGFRGPAGVVCMPEAEFWPPPCGCCFLVISCFFLRFSSGKVQAMIAWQWWNYYESENASGKRVFRMNMDETSICLYQGENKGNVFCHSHKRGHQDAPLQRVSRARLRTCLSHVAFICDDVTMQTVMPQILIANERNTLWEKFLLAKP